MTRRAGDIVPDFTATTADGDRVRLHDDAGSPLVLFFFPRAETPICTREACAFRDRYDALIATRARVFGCSGDSPDALRAFAARHRLPFPLIADTDGALRRVFGVGRRWGLVDARVTFVVDAHGVIRHVTDSLLSATRHVEDALAAVRRLGAAQASR